MSKRPDANHQMELQFHSTLTQGLTLMLTALALASWGLLSSDWDLPVEIRRAALRVASLGFFFAATAFLIHLISIVALIRPPRWGGRWLATTLGFLAGCSAGVAFGLLATLAFQAPDLIVK